MTSVIDELVSLLYAKGIVTETDADKASNP